MKKTLTLTALLASAPAFSMGCEVVTDAANDMVPSADIISANLFTQGNQLGVSITMSNMTLPSARTTYLVHWVDGSGNGYYAGVGNALAAGGNADPAGGLVADLGTYDPASGEYTWNENSDGQVSIDGNTLTLLTNPALVGNPSGKLTGIGAFSGEYLFYVPYDTTDNSGEWIVGDDCGKTAANEAQQSPAQPAPADKVEGACLIVEDGSMPTDNSTYGGGVIATTQDIVAVYMATGDNKLTTVIELATPPAHPSASYIVYWTDSNGGQFYTNAYLAADGTQEFEYGSWVQGAASIESSPIADTTGSVSGNSIAVDAKLLGVGNPTELTAYAVSGTGINVPGVISGSAFSDRTDEGLYTVGDTCAKADDYYGANYAANQALKSGDQSGASSANQMAAAGSFGWLMIAAGLLGLRRRTR